MRTMTKERRSDRKAMNHKKPISVMTEDGVFTDYESVTEASKALKISRQRIYSALKRENGEVYGERPRLYVERADDEA